MEDRKLIAYSFIKQGFPKSKVLSLSGVPKSSYYYKPTNKEKGSRTSTHTKTKSGKLVSNETVQLVIRELLSEEFVDYGYLKVCWWLRRNKDYIINPKKVYRLMREEGLLNLKTPVKRGKRNWVKDLLPQTEQPFDFLEFDIKYIYVAGVNRNALLLTVIDVNTRWVLGHYLHWQIKGRELISLFNQIFEVYPLPKHFHVRNDNGSQFIAQQVQQYFKDKEVVQEFCKPATPQQNAHIESYHSIVERVICSKYEFEDLLESQDTFNRFVVFYNKLRIHSGIGYQSPGDYLLENNIDMNGLELQKTLDCSTLQWKILNQA